MHLASRQPLPHVPTALVAAGVLLIAFLVGGLLARSVPVGMALLVGAIYAPIVLLSLPAGLALWMPLVFLEQLPGVGIGPTLAGLVIIMAWLGTVRLEDDGPVALLRRHRRLIATTLVFLVWLALSLLWAERPDMGGSYLVGWLVGGLLLLIVVTSVSTPRQLRLLLAAMVVGAVLSVIVGLVTGGPAGSATAGTVTAPAGRLRGGAADPNFLAAWLVPSIALAGGLLITARGAALRLALAASLTLMGLGLAATESRGGVIAGLVAAAAVVVVYRRHRAYAALFVVLLLGAGGAWFAANPGGWHRVTSYGDEGNGRADLWHVAGRMAADHPLLGVGLNNFRVESPRYVSQPGTLHFVDLIVERPNEPHNVYLQLLVETGPLGLALFVAIVLACLRASSRAADRFDRLGASDLGLIARAVLVAQIGSLTAAMFLSNGPDKIMWTVLALGPVLLAMATRPAAPVRERPPAPRASGPVRLAW